MTIVRKRARARRDLVEHYVYLAENAGIEVADSFLRHLAESISEIGRNPAIGSSVISESPRLQGLRKWPVRDFENVLIFYLLRNSDVSIIRVLHGAQDWWSLLGIV